MRAIGIAAVVTFGLVAAAHAQQECYPNNPQMPAAGTTCYPTGAPPLPAIPQASVSGPSTPVNHLNTGEYPAMCAGPPIANYGCYAGVKAERRDVGGMMADGRCDDAMKRALRESDYQMAATVKELCTTPSK